MLYLLRKASAGLAVTATIAVGFACAAQAANNIRYVSTKGSNSNPCNLNKPCRTLQRGINQTPAGGELHVLDSGSYGAKANIQIQKSITISGNGNTIMLSSVIVIADGSAVVALRGLALNGEGSTLHSIHAITAAAVHVERCVVHGFASHGIVSGGNNANLVVIDSIVRDNGHRGLSVFQTPTVTIDNVRFENNGDTGLYVQSSNSHAVVSRSVVAANQVHGIVANGSRMTVTQTRAAHNGRVGYFVMNGGQMTLESSVAHGHRGAAPQGIGLDVIGGGSTARISNSAFVNNINGVVVNTGTTVLTRRNNIISGNSSNVIGTLTTLGGL